MMVERLFNKQNYGDRDSSYRLHQEVEVETSGTGTGNIMGW